MNVPFASGLSSFTLARRTVTGYSSLRCGQEVSMSTEIGAVWYLIAILVWDRRFCSR